jgi:hypothetical protein
MVDWEGRQTVVKLQYILSSKISITNGESTSDTPSTNAPSFHATSRSRVLGYAKRMMTMV